MTRTLFPVQTCSLPPSWSLPLLPPSSGFSVSRLQHQTPLRIPVKISAIPSASHREKSSTRNLKELLTPESMPQLRSSFALFCSSYFFIWVAFCSWTPAIYSVKGKAAFWEGSLEKLLELFGFACPSAWQCCTSESTPPRLLLRVSAVTQLQLQCHWGNETIKNYKILCLPWIFKRSHARPWQTSIGTAPLQSPEMCWLVSAKEPSRWHFFVITKMNIPPPATKPKDLHYSK